MNEMSGGEKENEVIPDTNSGEAKKQESLKDTISRLLLRKGDADADADAEEGEGSAK